MDTVSRVGSVDLPTGYSADPVQSLRRVELYWNPSMPHVVRLMLSVLFFMSTSLSVRSSKRHLILCEEDTLSRIRG